MNSRWWRVAVAAVGFAAVGLTALPARADPVFHTLVLAGETFDTEWHPPTGRAAGLVLLQHGFGRRCANLRGTARAFAAAGLLVLCLNADMARGNPALAAAYARALLAGEVPSPDGTPLPEGLVAAGHSAGGLFAAHLGQALAAAAPRRLAGVVLLDVVGAQPLADALAAMPHHPVRAVVAPPSACNAQQQSLAVLQALRGPEVAVELGPDATHLDAEGADSERVAQWACRQGPPREPLVSRLRQRAVGWALEMLSASATSRASPGPR